MQVSANVADFGGRVSRYQSGSSNTGFALNHSSTFSQPPIPVKDYERYEATSTNYVIKSGDTLSAIAQRYGITVEQLYQDNKDLIGDNPNMIYPGQELIIRSKEDEVEVVQSVQYEQPVIMAEAPTPEPTVVIENVPPALAETETTSTTSISGPSPNGHLTRSGGVFNGPSGKETYYNLKMNGVVNIMRNMGYSEEEYPYWIREDGAKMLGQYIMVAADLSTRPRGTILETSLGTAMVCDTGTFIYENQQQVDIAVNW